jgi:3,4-dihydroxy-2-butanone 4-phosphate synthase
MPFCTVEEAISDIRAGRFIIILDDENRENEGDLMMAAENVTPEAINFMARFGRGLICMPMTAERLRELDIPLMTSQNTESMGTALPFRWMPGSIPPPAFPHSTGRRPFMP